MVASPLSLSMMLDDKGLDFLSSIDILVVDRADVLSMQNWQHLATSKHFVLYQRDLGFIHRAWLIPGHQ